MEDKHTYGKKMARKGRTKVIYKGTFVCIQTLCSQPKLSKRKVSAYTRWSYQAVLPDGLLLPDGFTKRS